KSDDPVFIGVAVRVRPLEVRARLKARLETLRRATQSEGDERDVLSQRDHPVAVAPGAERELDVEVGAPDYVRDRLNLDALVVDLAQVLDLRRAAVPARRRQRHGH